MSAKNYEIWFKVIADTKRVTFLLDHGIDYHSSILLANCRPY